LIAEKKRQRQKERKESMKKSPDYKALNKQVQSRLTPDTFS